MFDMIGIDQAAKLLKVHPSTLRRHETPDGRWCDIYGIRIRVYRLSHDRNGQRRYDRGEIERLMNRMARRA